MSKILEDSHFKFIDFCAHNVNLEQRLEKAELTEKPLCPKCKRLVCKRKVENNGVKETDLECLLRHIRNAIAHGHVKYKHAGNRIYIMFEDYNPNKKLTARILIIRADLEKWIKTLKKF